METFTDKDLYEKKIRINNELMKMYSSKSREYKKLEKENRQLNKKLNAFNKDNNYEFDFNLFSTTTILPKKEYLRSDIYIMTYIPMNIKACGYPYFVLTYNDLEKELQNYYIVIQKQYVISIIHFLTSLHLMMT